MESEFKILVDRLKSGRVEKIRGAYSSGFFDIHEKELVFPLPVEIQGEAYLSNDHLILHLKGKTEAKMPCAVCNEMTRVVVEVKDLYHAEPMEALKDGVFDYSEKIREAFLIEVPKVVECNGGKCPERPSIAPYLRSKARVENPTYFPFSDLETDNQE